MSNKPHLYDPNDKDLNSYLQNMQKKLSYNGNCENCHQIKEKMYKCQKCLIVRYCGKECQKIDWPKHKLICKMTKSDDPLVKLSKISNIGIISYVAVQYKLNNWDINYPFCELYILNDSFFSDLEGKGKINKGDVLMTVKHKKELEQTPNFNLNPELFYIQCKYKDKYISFTHHREIFKEMLDLDVIAVRDKIISNYYDNLKKDK